MKKRLLSFFMATAAVAVYAQPMFYVNDVDVKVEENTLVYVGGAFEKTSTIANDGKVINDGNIFVNGDFTNASSEDFFLLTNKNEDNSTYGQLIIDDAAAVTGKVSLTRQLATGQDYIQISFPFSDATANGIIEDMELSSSVAAPRYVSCTPNTGVSCGARYVASMLFWENDEVLFETVSDGDAILDPSKYYILNAENRHTDAAGKLVTLTGTPENTAFSPSLVPMDDAIDLSVLNKYNESYTDYQEDIALGTDTSDDNWGENQYQFGNSFTSNLDLSYIGISESSTIYNDDQNDLDGLQAAAFAAATTEDIGGGRESAITTSKIGFDAQGEKAVGDVNVPFIIQPTVPYVLKFDGTNGAQSFNMSDGIRVFSFDDRAIADSDGTVGQMSVGGNQAGNSINQVGVAIFDSEGNTDGNRFYVAASDQFVDVARNRSEMGTVMPKNGMYTIQEATDGSIRQDQVDTPLFVNGISNSYVGLAIPVGINIDESNPITNYTIRTSFRSQDGRVLEQDVEFNTGKNFIFHDKQENEIRVMDDSFEYSFTQDSDTNTRFEIFYGEIPNFLNTNDLLSSGLETKVYRKDGKAYSVRFSADQLGDTASVTVFNSIGQLISFEKNLSTDVDHDLKLVESASSLYVVRIEGENGTVVTKKIIR